MFCMKKIKNIKRLIVTVQNEIIDLLLVPFWNR